MHYSREKVGDLAHVDSTYKQCLSGTFKLLYKSLVDLNEVICFGVYIYILYVYIKVYFNDYKLI